MRFAAVIFDMGDVLFDATRWRRALVEHLRGRGVAIDYPEFCRRWEARLVEVYLGRREYWARLRAFLTDLGLAGAPLEETLVFARQQAAVVEQRTLFDGVAATLAALKGMGLKLAVLSDTESREPRVRQRLADLGIETCFDAVITSVDIGRVKADPAAYSIALSRLGASADATMFVGHDEEELAGARRCGLTAVAYNAAPGVTCDHRMDRFSDLLKLVGP